MHFRAPRTFLIPLILLAALPAGCKRDEAPDPAGALKQLGAELEDTRQKLAAAEKTLAVRNDDVAVATAADKERPQSMEGETTLVQRDAQIRALQAELAGLKKSDAMAFAEASEARQRGVNSVALDRYEQFLKDFPQSPMADDATRAVAELTDAVQRETRSRVSLIDARRPEREILKRFGDGTVTVKEIAPLLRGRSRSEILKLLGPPGQLYRDGKELGYVDKVIDTATGKKETLVIGFESDSVTTLRLGYLGRPIKP